MANSIVSVNVNVVVAPTPATLQQSGALISQGGTDTSPGTASLLTQLSDLTPLLSVPAAITSLIWSGGVVTASTTSPHNLPQGEVIKLQVVGAVPIAYNGTYLATVTGQNTFTYPLVSNPGSETSPGTWQNWSAIEITQMATSFFAQGSSRCATVLELGAGDINSGVAALTAYLIANPNSNYTPGALGYFYSYEVPRGWDAKSSYLSLLASYQSPTSRTYFFTTTTLATYSAYTNLDKCVVALIESPVFDAYPANVLTAISYSGGIVTGTTTTNHGVSVGSWFTIAGCTPTGYNGTFLAQIGTTGSTLVYNLAVNPGAESVLGTLQGSLYPNAGIPSTEFTMSAVFQASLNYAPSTTNKITQLAFTYLFGVTPFPKQGQNALLATLKASNINIVGTGAEGGISDAIVLWGTTLDGNDFTYWYGIDWIQINLDLNTANAVINGSNNLINPLYYNQPGIDVIQSVGASTMNQAVTYGMANGTLVLTTLDGTTLGQNLDAGDYAGKIVMNAVPFPTYAAENPSDYKERQYLGLSAIWVPQNGFIHIGYNVTVTELIAQ